MKDSNEEFTVITSDGWVLWSQRIAITLLCDMYFGYYPLDVQVCDVSIESYGGGDPIV